MKGGDPSQVELFDNDPSSGGSLLDQEIRLFLARAEYSEFPPGSVELFKRLLDDRIDVGSLVVGAADKELNISMDRGRLGKCRNRGCSLVDLPIPRHGQ